jgi:hypothetical protein
MNLQSLRQKVKNITDYSPELQQFDNQIDQLLNDAYYELWSSKRWSFSTKRNYLHLWTDITSTTDTERSGGNEINCSVTYDSRLVTLSHSIGRLNHTEIWEGQPIEIQSREYTISKILSLDKILLTGPFEGETAVDDTSFVIKKRYYDLPEDCLELLYAGYRDEPYNSIKPWGKASGLLPRTEEDYDLRVDFAMDFAEAYIPTPSQAIPSGERLGLDITTGTSDIPLGYYELCWAFIREGKIGPLSEPIVYEQQEDNTAIAVKFLSYDDLSIASDGYDPADKVAPQWEGYTKTLFWNKNLNRTTGERTGLPCWIQITNGGPIRSDAFLEPISVPDTTDTIDIRYINQFDNGSARYIERDGLHQQIRFYPRPIGYDTKKVILDDRTDYYREMVLRYVKKPQDMLLPTDTPEMPYEFHQLIVYKALHNIYLKLGQSGLAQTYENKYDKELQGLRKRYVDKIDTAPVRGQFHFGQAKGRYDSSMLKWGK